MEIRKANIYEHYHGGLYEVVSIGAMEGTHEEVVIYRSLQDSHNYPSGTVWVRPKAEFVGTVLEGGVPIPRFRHLGPKPKHRLIGKFFAVAYFDLLLVFTSLILLLGIFVVTRDFRDPGFFFAIHPVLGWIVTAFFAVCIFCIGYARFIGPWKLLVNHKKIPLAGLTSPIRIALIADLQVGDHKREEWMERVVEKIIRLKPDAVLIAGDLVSNELNPEDESVYLEPLAALPKLCPTLAVLGNHDYGIGLLSGGVTIRTQDKSEQVKRRCEALGVKVLQNELITLTVRGQSIAIFGADDEWGSRHNFSALQNWNKTDPILLLAHNPDALLSWPDNYPQPALELSGHTHGGQLCLPFIGPIGDAYIKLPKKFYRGLHYHNKVPVFVTTGVGESLGPLRLGAPPEIALLTLE